MNKTTLAATGHTDVSEYYLSLAKAYMKDKKAGLKQFQIMNRKDRCECICYLIDVASTDHLLSSFAVIAAKAFTRWNMTFDNMFE